MPGLHVDDVGSIAVAVVKLKFVNTKDFCMFFRPDQLPVRCGVQFKQAFLIYCLYDVLAQTGKFSYLLVRVSPTGQEITDILMQLCRDTVSRGLEGIYCILVLPHLGHTYWFLVSETLLRYPPNGRCLRVMPG